MAKENDIVLVHIEDSPSFFARIETIQPDVKKDWYHVKLLILQFPMNTVTWILRDIYINGQPFQMNGKNVILEHVPYPFDDDDRIDEEEEDSPVEKKEGKVITLNFGKKNKEEE